MPVIKREDFGTERAPAWCKVDGGVVNMGCSVRDQTGSVELHYHDAEEFWFVIKGKARITTEGETFIVEPGDVVCTKMGDQHSIEEIVEAPYSQVWMVCNLRGQKRKGHLHRGQDD